MTTLTTEEIDAYPSRQFKGFDWSETEEVKLLIDVYFGLYLVWAKETDGQERIKQQKELKEHLTCFVLEAYRTYKANPNMAMAVSLGKGTISNYQKSRYKPSHLSYRLVNHIVKFMLAKYLLYLPLGEIGRATGAPTHQRATRLQATDALIQIAEELGVNKYMITTYPTPPEIIVLRSKKLEGQKVGDKEEYEDTPFTLQARANLEQINQFIEQHLINLEINDDQEKELSSRLRNREEDGKDKYLDFSNTRLRRIFNNSSFEQGARLYGGFWQQIPKEYRALITINDKRTIQLDYSGMHFIIMYANKGLPIPKGDPYTMDEYDPSLRSDIKTAFNTIVNCSTVDEAKGAIDKAISNGKLSSELIDGEQVLNAFKVKHAEISNFIASGEGMNLQFIDSQIAERVLLKGMEENVCILPIHDGFIANTGDESKLHQWMSEAFEEVTGESINIKLESIYLELIVKYNDAHDSSYIDEEGVEHKEPETLEGKARSYSSIETPKGILEEMLKSTNYEERRKEWFRAKGIN